MEAKLISARIRRLTNWFILLSCISEGITLINVYHIYGWQTLSFTRIKSGSVCTQTQTRHWPEGVTPSTWTLNSYRIENMLLYIYASSLLSFPNGTEHLRQCFISDLSVKCLHHKIVTLFCYWFGIIAMNPSYLENLSNTKLAYWMPGTHFQFGYLLWKRLLHLFRVCLPDDTRQIFYRTNANTLWAFTLHMR